jgi:two-component system OmpR family sensor kinase
MFMQSATKRELGGQRARSNREKSVARCQSVPPERLTRHEISWLLAQEARGAAKSLRTEVVQRRAPSDPHRLGEPVETTLDALDDTIEMLSALNVGGRTKGRRGRIDLAALLVEIAPNARLALEPGAGTEVFGDESELRRMLHLLVAQASGRTPAESSIPVRIRRQGDFIRISADLGPDTAALGELESRWLARMALRHGGSVELEGGTHSIILQADGAIDQREVTELRKELAEAQQLGEAYARELASVLSAGDVRTEAPPPSRGDPERFEGVKSLAAATHRVLRGVSEKLRVALDANGSAESSRELIAVQELVSELGSVADCTLDAPAEALELATVIRDVIQGLEARASRAQVMLAAEVRSDIKVRAAKAPLELLIKSLIAHAIAATPQGGSVTVVAFPTEIGITLTVRDGGPAVPEASRWPVIRHHVDPTRFGRPAGVNLVLADAATTALQAELELEESADGHTETWVNLRKA